MNREEAIKATKNGAIAACISGGVTLALVFYAIFSNANNKLGIWNDPSNLFDIVIIFGCAYGIYKKSRFAAVLLFLHFILAKIIIGIELGKLPGIWTSLIFLFFYGKAIQGTFSFHKIEKTENPNYKPTPKWAYYAGIPTLIIFLVLMGFGLMTLTGVMPSTEVQSGVEMLQKDKDTLVSNNILNINDKIQYFYSNGLTSILEGGSVLTENRVILYLKDENLELQVYEIDFNDISSVELIENGNYMNDSIYRVNSYQPDAWIQLALSAEDRGDVRFIEALRSNIRKLNP
jgi:hypothetical protein